MWRSELLNLPGGSVVRFGEAFASFVRVPLTGSTASDSDDSGVPKLSLPLRQYSSNCSSLRTSNLLLKASDTAALHLPLFDELSRSTTDVKRYLVALLYDEATKSITHVRTKAPARLYAANWPYLVALQDLDASIAPPQESTSSNPASSNASDKLEGRSTLTTQSELLEVMLFESKTEAVRFMLPLNFVRGTTRFLILIDSGVFLITEYSIYFASFSSIISSTSLTRATTLVYSESSFLLPQNTQPRYDANYCKCSGSTLVLANTNHIKVITWDTVPVLCASGRVKFLEPFFASSAQQSHVRLRLEASFNDPILDIRISPNGSIVALQTNSTIFYCYLGSFVSDEPLPADFEKVVDTLKELPQCEWINLFEGRDTEREDTFQSSHSQVSLLLHVDDSKVVIGSVRHLETFILNPKSGRLEKDGATLTHDLSSNVAFLAPNSEFVSMIGIHSVIPMHVTVNDKGGVAVWDLSLALPETLLAHAQLPLGPVLDAYWLEHTGELHFVILHKERVIHKWIALRHLLLKLNSPGPVVEWSDALTSPILYEGALMVREENGPFVERWFRLRPFVLFVYRSRFSTANLGVYLLDPHIRLFRDGSSTRFTLANGRMKHDFVAPNSIEADRVVHALMYQLSSTQSLASIWTIPYADAISYQTSSTRNSSLTFGNAGLSSSAASAAASVLAINARAPTVGIFLSTQPVVLKDQPSTYPSTEFLLLTILEHPSIIPLIGLMPQFKRGDKLTGSSSTSTSQGLPLSLSASTSVSHSSTRHPSIDMGNSSSLMQTLPNSILLESGRPPTSTVDMSKPSKLVMPKQLLDLGQLIELLCEPSTSTGKRKNSNANTSSHSHEYDDSSSDYSLDDSNLQTGTRGPLPAAAISDEDISPPLSPLATGSGNSMDALSQLEEFRKMASSLGSQSPKQLSSSHHASSSQASTSAQHATSSAPNSSQSVPSAAKEPNSPSSSTPVVRAPETLPQPRTLPKEASPTKIQLHYMPPESTSMKNVLGHSSSSTSSVSSTGTKQAPGQLPGNNPPRRPKNVPTGTIPWKTVLRILMGLASGLSTLHHFEFNGRPVPIAHRDLKCENVLIQASSIEACVLQARCKSLLADFEHAFFTRPLSTGSSRLAHFSDNPYLNKVTDMSSAAKASSREDVVGDEKYRDPDETASPLAHDIYCFGLVAWQLMTLHPLTFGRNAVEQMESVGGLTPETMMVLHRWCAPKAYTRPDINAVIKDLAELALNVVLYGRQITPVSNPNAGFHRRSLYAHERLQSALINAFVTDFPSGRKLKVFYGAPSTGKSLLLKTAMELAEISNFLPVFARARHGYNNASGILLDLAADLYSQKYATMPHMVQPPTEIEQVRFLQMLNRRDRNSAPPPFTWSVLRSLFTRVSQQGTLLLLVIDDLHFIDSRSLEGLIELLQEPFCFAIASALPNTSFRSLSSFMHANQSMWEVLAGGFQLPGSGLSGDFLQFQQNSHIRSPQLLKKQSSSTLTDKRSVQSVVHLIMKGQFSPYTPSDDSIGKLSNGYPILKALTKGRPVPETVGRKRALSVESDSSLSSAASYLLGSRSSGGEDSTQESEMCDLALFGLEVILKILIDRVAQEGVVSSTSTKWRQVAERILKYTMGIPAYVMRYLANIPDLKTFVEDLMNRREPASASLKARYSITYDAKTLWGSLSTTAKHKLIVASFLDFEFSLEELNDLSKKLVSSLPNVSTDNAYSGDLLDQPDALYVFLKQEPDTTNRYRFASEEARRLAKQEIISNTSAYVVEFLKTSIDTMKQLSTKEIYHYQQMMWELGIGMRQPTGDSRDILYVNALLSAAAITAGTEVQQSLFEHASAFLLSPVSLKAIMQHNPHLLIGLCLELERASLIHYALQLLEIKPPGVQLPEDVQEELAHLRARLLMRSDQEARYQIASSIVLEFLTSHLPLPKENGFSAPKNSTLAQTTLEDDEEREDDKAQGASSSTDLLPVPGAILENIVNTLTKKSQPPTSASPMASPVVPRSPRSSLASSVVGMVASPLGLSDSNSSLTTSASSATSTTNSTSTATLTNGTLGRDSSSTVSSPSSTPTTRHGKNPYSSNNNGLSGKPALDVLIQNELPVLIDHLTIWLYPSASSLSCSTASLSSSGSSPSVQNSANPSSHSFISTTSPSSSSSALDTSSPATSRKAMASSSSSVSSATSGIRSSTLSATSPSNSSMRGSSSSVPVVSIGPPTWSYGPVKGDSRPKEHASINKAFAMIETVLYLSNPTAPDFDGQHLEPLVVLYLFITYAYRHTICPYILINCACAMARFPSVSLQLFQLAWSLLNDWPMGFEKPNLVLPFSSLHGKDPEADAAAIRSRAYISLSTDFLYRLDTRASLQQYLEEARKIAAAQRSQDLLAEVQLASCQYSLFLGETADDCAREVPLQALKGTETKHSRLLQTFYLCSQALLEPKRAEQLSSVLSSRRRTFFPPALLMTTNPPSPGTSTASNPITVPSTSPVDVNQPMAFSRSDLLREEVLDYLAHAHTSLLLGDSLRAYKCVRRAFRNALILRGGKSNTLSPAMTRKSALSASLRSQVPSFTVIYIACLVAYISTLEFLRATSRIKKEKLRKTIEANAEVLSKSCAQTTSHPSSACARLFGPFAQTTCGLVPTALRFMDTIKMVVRALVSHSKMSQETTFGSPTQLPSYLNQYNSSVAAILPSCIEGMSRATIRTFACYFGELGMKLGFLSSTHYVTQYVILASATYDCLSDMKCFSRLRLLENSPSFTPYLTSVNAGSASVRLRRALSPSDYIRMFVELIANNPEHSIECINLLRDAMDVVDVRPLLSLPNLLGGGAPSHVVFGLAGIQQVVQLFHDRIDYEVIMRPEQAVRSPISRATFVQFLVWCILAFDHVNRAVDDFFSPLEMKVSIGFLEREEDESAQTLSSPSSGSTSTPFYTPFPAEIRELESKFKPKKVTRADSSHRKGYVLEEDEGHPRSYEDRDDLSFGSLEDEDEARLDDDMRSDFPLFEEDTETGARRGATHQRGIVPSMEMNSALAVAAAAAAAVAEERVPSTMQMLLKSSARFTAIQDKVEFGPLPDYLCQFLRPILPHIQSLSPQFKYYEAKDPLTPETYRALKISWNVLPPLKFSKPKSFIIVSDHEKKGLLRDSLTQRYGSDIHVHMLRSADLLWASPGEASHILVHETCWNDSLTSLLEVHQSRHPRTAYVFVSERASTSSKPMFHITSFRHNVAIDIDAFHAQPTAPLLLIPN